MVSSFLKTLRTFVPALALIALLAMFLKLPEAPSVFGLFTCKTCSSNSPYIPLIGGAYFAVLLAAALLFPSFPSTQVARGGLLWSVLLLLSLTYMHLPHVCAPCLLGHLCNVLIWGLWVIAPSEPKSALGLPRQERFFLMLMAPMVVAALLGTLNLTLLIYGLKNSQNHLATGLKPGDGVPPFQAKTQQGRSIANSDLANRRFVINFVAADCMFCKEQLAILNAGVNQLKTDALHIINVSPTLPPDLVAQLPTADWVEDQEGTLRALFKVEGYPTLFVLGNDDTIKQVLPGASEELKTTLYSLVEKG